MYTTLSLPQDNQRNILDGIVNGELNNIPQQIPIPDTDNMPTGHRTSVGAASSSTSISSNYITREEIEQMLNIYRHHIVSDVSGLCGDLKTTIVEQSRRQERQFETILQNQKELFDQHRKWQQDHYEDMQSRLQPGNSSTYQTLFDNQKQFFQQQQQWQEEHYQGMQSSMQNYIDTILNSVRCYIDDQNSKMLNKLSDCQSNMEVVIASLQQDVPAHSSPIVKHASTSQQIEDVETSTKRKAKGEKIQSSTPSTNYLLEDYDLERDTIRRDGVVKNPSSEYWDDGTDNLYTRDTIKTIMDTTQDISATHLDLELKLLRRLINDGCTLLSKEYAILDFQFEKECTRQIMLQRSIQERSARNTLDLTLLEEYINGNLPTSGRPWITCNYLLIPCSYSGNNWYLFLVNFREWKFQIYDCSHNLHTPQQIRTRANGVLNLVQTLLMSSEFSIRQDIRKNRNKQMELDIIPYLPCTNNGPNCGIFLLKYIECFIFGYPIEAVSPDRMTIYRRKIAVDICYNEYYLHPR